MPHQTKNKRQPRDLVKIGEPLNCEQASLEWIEAAEGGGENKLPRFTMTAYTGGPMNVSAYYRPVVVDLAGLKAEGDAIPIYLGHDPAQIVGHASVEISQKRVKASGVVSGGGAVAQEVVAAAKNGFPWKASIGVLPQKVEWIDPGATAQANGRTFKGPCNIVRGGVLGEISFVPQAADSNTRVSVAAHATQTKQEKTMNPGFKEWLEATGFDAETLSAEQLVPLQAAYDGEQAAEKEKIAAAKAKKTEEPIEGGNDGANAVEDYRMQIAAERERINAIATLCDGGHGEIEAEAIKDGWTVEKAEVAVLRASRPKAPAGHTSGRPQITGQVIEAAACRTLGLQNADEQFDEKVLEAADKNFRHEIGLQEMILLAAQENGFDARTFREGELRPMLKAAFSSASLSGILSNTANKFLLESFNAVENVWRRIAAVGTVKDFKTNTRYRLTGDFTYAELGPNGEIQHGTVDEESFTISADTYARMFALTRTMIINDDLGALAAIPRRLGRGAALKVNNVFWTAFMDNAAFFAAGNNNYYADAAANLQSSSLATVEQMFVEQVDPDGDPIAVTPKFLLTPPALSVTARELFASTNINTGGSSTKAKVPNANIFAEKYEPIVSAYLSNALYTGYSSLAWYLLADPSDLATIEMVFLNGKQEPTVESADADFDTLGIQVRGYHDFGCAKQDTRAGVKSKGEA